MRLEVQRFSVVGSGFRGYGFSVQDSAQPPA